MNKLNPALEQLDADHNTVAKQNSLLVTKTIRLKGEDLNVRYER